MGLMVASAEALSYVLRNRRREAKTFAVISFGNDVPLCAKNGHGRMSDRCLLYPRKRTSIGL